VKTRFSDEAKRDLLSLATCDKARVLGVLKRLAAWPSVSGWKPMRSEWTGHGRIRTGDWRVIFRMPRAGDDVILVVKIGHRSVIYED
jgi:mRNA-degrading endonuclease RelE of RelBE toxin-antitoxin system